MTGFARFSVIVFLYFIVILIVCDTKHQGRKHCAPTADQELRNQYISLRAEINAPHTPLEARGKRQEARGKRMHRKEERGCIGKRKEDA
ncbi:hypothetical protein AM228_14625 [Planktothricoides sp. SR001]|nr:hypothetical protein AM228_14625 [Planktothricoides sp. SR001]